MVRRRSKWPFSSCLIPKGVPVEISKRLQIYLRIPHSIETGIAAAAYFISIKFHLHSSKAAFCRNFRSNFPMSVFGKLRLPEPDFTIIQIRGQCSCHSFSHRIPGGLIVNAYNTTLCPFPGKFIRNTRYCPLPALPAQFGSCFQSARY